MNFRGGGPWIEGAPRYGINTDEECCQFIDKYIFCEIPDEKEDPELHGLVTKLQTHRCIKSKCKKKKGDGCRYNFPRLPSEYTLITAGQHCEEYTALDPELKKHFKVLFNRVKTALEKENAEKFLNLDDFLHSLNISKEGYYKMLKFQ